jgi:Icc-related predicted phosphoesterase
MILMFGDIHGNIGHILPAVIAEKASAIILLGDIQAQRPLHLELAEVMKVTEVYWIHGNHDNDSQSDYDNLFNSELADRNLHGKIVEIDGLKVAGLGGIFREHIWRPVPVTAEPLHISYAAYEAHLKEQVRYKKISEQKRTHELFKHKTSIFYEDWINLYGQQADILVTHEAPSCHPYGFEAIDVLARSMKIKCSFHAHHHDRLNYSAYDEILGFSAHGVGFCGVTDQYGGMVSAGDFDQQRMGRQGRI